MDYYEDGIILFSVEVTEKGKDHLTFTLQSETLFKDEKPPSITITSYPSSLKRGETFLCKAKIEGEDRKEIPLVIEYKLEHHPRKEPTCVEEGLRYMECIQYHTVLEEEVLEKLSKKDSSVIPPKKDGSDNTDSSNTGDASDTTKIKPSEGSDEKLIRILIPVFVSVLPLSLILFFLFHRFKKQ